VKELRGRDLRTLGTTPESFTSGVLRELLVPPQVEDGLLLTRFRYPPGGHSHWHVHEGEQAILVEQGRMRVGRRDGGALLLEAGDALYVAPGEEHWHGATPDQALVHLAFNGSGPTHWLEPVDDEAYGAGS
jgi:quercetin dioxygenase-like cupin family protein